MNKFTLGAIAGIATIGLAVPILAQVSSAATGTSARSASATRPQFQHRVPTQQEVKDMADRDAAFLKNIDAFVTVQKTARQAHLQALTAAAAITDDTQRDSAVKKANEAERAAIQAAIVANPALDMMGGRGPGVGGGKVGPGMMGGRGPDTAALATKLGMTEAELKAALDGGKTIEQIATEKGITLPAGKGKGGMHGGGWMMGGPKGTQPTGSAATAK